MDRLSVSLAIARGRRLYHGQPFVVFALDLRDPLGLCLARWLHKLGDAADVEMALRRADDRERAPTMVVCSSVAHARKLVQALDETPDVEVRTGCTAGDLGAVRAFVRRAREPGDDVHVFLAADEERTVYRFPRSRGGATEPRRPLDPLLFLPMGDAPVASANDTTPPDDDLDDLDDLDALDLPGAAAPDAEGPAAEGPDAEPPGGAAPAGEPSPDAEPGPSGPSDPPSD